MALLEFKKHVSFIFKSFTFYFIKQFKILSGYCSFNPVWVSDILSPHANLNTKLVMLFPNLLLNGYVFSRKISYAKNNFIFALCHFLTAFQDICRLMLIISVNSNNSIYIRSVLIQYSNAVLRPRPFTFLFTSCVRIVHSG